MRVAPCVDVLRAPAADKQFFMAGSIEIFYSDRMPGLPPLNALRAFEASARHLSMKEAAAELSVTPGAVSQLVRGLEERLGTQLFRRGNRSLVLTEAGQNYFAPIRHAFRQIGEATRRLRALPNAGVLTVSAPPAFAASWLVPRLGRFRTRHADIELNIATTRGLANFAGDGVDVAIRHGLGRYPGLRCDRIASIAMIPVCSPRLLASLGESGTAMSGRSARPAAAARRGTAGLGAVVPGAGCRRSGSGHVKRHQLRRPDAADPRRGVASGGGAGDRDAGAAGTRARWSRARAGCGLAAGVFLLAGVPARYRRPAKDRCVPRLAAGGRPEGQRERASSQASKAGPNTLRLL